MPCSRSCALRASSLPTNSAILPPCGSASLINVPGLPAGGDVVGADVALALAVGRVAVVREDERLLRRVVQHRRLVGRIDRADGDAVHAFRQQVVHDALLRRPRFRRRDGTRLSTSANSAAAFSVPLRAIVQKSAALFVMKASLWSWTIPAATHPRQDEQARAGQPYGTSSIDIRFSLFGTAARSTAVTTASRTRAARRCST